MSIKRFYLPRRQRADGVDFPLTDKLDMMLELFRNEK